MDQLTKLLTDLQRRVEKLEGGSQLTKITIPAGGFFVMQKVTSDPVSPIEGQSWENITTHHYKMYLNGVVTTIV